jgi:hypothetical protein
MASIKGFRALVASQYSRGHMYNVPARSAHDTRKWDKKSDSCAAKKGAKKLVRSNFAKTLNKKVATKKRETCEKHNLLPLVQ